MADCLAGYWIGSSHWVTPEKALKLLQHDIGPLQDHGAGAMRLVAGGRLFLAGLISGYHDNTAIYHQDSERIAQLPVAAAVARQAAGRAAGRYLGEKSRRAGG